MLEPVVEPLALITTDQVQRELSFVAGAEAPIDALRHQAARAIVVEGHVGMDLMPSVSPA